MDTAAIIGVPIGFALLTSLTIWFLFGRRGEICFKALLLVGVVWYGLAMYYVPRRMMGWPAKGLPETGVLLFYKVIEPSVNPSESGIYLWIVPKERHVERCFFDPREIFEYTFRNVPKAYRIPYRKQEHKDLDRANKKAREVNGIVRFKGAKKKGKKGKSDRGGQDPEDDSNWSVLDPTKIFQKTETQEENTTE